jgi:hypothetical protein
MPCGVVWCGVAGKDKKMEGIVACARRLKSRTTAFVATCKSCQGIMISCKIKLAYNSMAYPFSSTEQGMIFV